MTSRVLQEYIRLLEDRLLHGDHSAQPDSLQTLLGENFREINPDGQVVHRQSVIDWLLQKDPAHQWEFNDFEIRELGPGRVLATYHARQTIPEKPDSKGAMHCSLWEQRSGGETWQLVFHQSTRVK